LRITIQETELATLLTLEGRVAGPWAAELGRVWAEEAPRLTRRKLAVDISNVIFADADGTRALRDIYSQARPSIVASTPWTKYLAEQMSANSNEDSGQNFSDNDGAHKEQENADHD
jgi:anti-anti-sigma regulatory factor